MKITIKRHHLAYAFRKSVFVPLLTIPAFAAIALLSNASLIDLVWASTPLLAVWVVVFLLDLRKAMGDSKPAGG